MESLNQEQVRTLIGRFYIHNYHTGKVFTFKHFSTIEIQKSLIYRVIQRYEEGSKPSTSLELEDLPRNYLLNMLDNLYLNPLVELAFPCKNWPPNMEFLPGMLEKPSPRMVKRQPCSSYSPRQAERARAAADDLKRNFFLSSIIPFIQKSNNSPNSPQIRQIEKFSAILKERAAGRHQFSEC